MSTVTSVTTTLRRRRGLTEEAAVAAVDQACRRLRLPTMRALLGDAVAAANKDQLTYTGFLAELLLAECDDRDRRRVLLGDHDFDPAASFEADLRAADADVVANRRVRHLNGVVFLDEADVDPAGGVPLLPRRLKVGAEHVVDGRLERIQPGRGPLDAGPPDATEVGPDQAVTSPRRSPGGSRIRPSHWSRIRLSPPPQG